MICSHCNTKTDSSLLHCPTCGNILKPSQETISPSIIQVKKKIMPFWFKCAIFLALLGLIAVTGGILFTETLVDVVEHQLKELRVNNISKAYDYTSKEFQKNTSLEQFRQFVEDSPIFLQNHSGLFTQRSIEEHIGTIKGELISENHQATPIEYHVVKEDGQWKILSIQFLPSEDKDTKEIYSLDKVGK
jgi:hypothetical protein